MLDKSAICTNIYKDFVWKGGICEGKQEDLFSVLTECPFSICDHHFYHHLETETFYLFFCTVQYKEISAIIGSAEILCF